MDLPDLPPFCSTLQGLKNASIGVDIEPIPIGESSSAPRCARSDRRSGPVGSRARQLRGQHPPQSLGARYRHVVEQLANDAGLAAAYLGLGRRGFGVHGDKRSRAAADFFLRRSPGPTYCSRRHQFVSSPALSHAFFQRLMPSRSARRERREPRSPQRPPRATDPTVRWRYVRRPGVSTDSSPRLLTLHAAVVSDIAATLNQGVRDLLGAPLESPRSAAWHRSAKAV